MSTLWRNWLFVWCFGVFVFGTVLAAAAFEATAGPTRMVFDFIGSGADADLTDPALRFSLAVLGAVSIGWSITLFAAIQAAIDLDGSGGRTWRLITLSVVAWFVIDTALSVLTGFALNAIPNTALIAGYLLPVIMSGALKD